MSVQAPIPLLESDPRDPFQLQRLADELIGDDDEDSLHALPTYLPLSHSDPYLSAPIFDVEKFLQSRSYTSLPDLRLELRDYLAALKEELVQLINDDYEAFISLSTDLRGEGTRLERLKWPLTDLKGQTLASKQELQHLKSDIQEKLKKRAALREEKAFLHLLLKISESITRLESLLLIASPEHSSSPQVDTVDIPPNPKSDEDIHDDRVRGNRAKHLSRVAAEYTQLLYHVSKAQPGKCAFVDEIQWRIDRIKSTLFSDLDHLLATTLSCLTDGKDPGQSGKMPELDRMKWMADITECLRTYDVLGLWRDAEEVLKREVMDTFVKKFVFPNALSVPRSPLVPHTPLPVSSHSPISSQTASYYPPRTPYTPFTAFASKQNPFGFPSSSLHLLDEAEDPLAGLYNQIIKFVDRDLRKIMETAEIICVKSGSRKKTELELHPSPPRRSGDGFEIMANVVWAEVGRAIMEELGHIVFAAGKTDEFRKHHETTEAFVRSLEFLAPSIHSVEVMRTHPIYATFQRRWQVQTYFQLRWKEIVGKLEESLVVTRIDRAKDHAPFATRQSLAIWVAISTCWSAEVYMPVLSHRFWRLTLQLLSRYKTWLEASLPPFELPAKVAAITAAAEKGISPISRSSTPGPVAETTSTETTEADNTLLKQFTAAVTDIIAIEKRVLNLWNEELSIMLPEGLESEDQNIHEDAEAALRQAIAPVTNMIPSLSTQITVILTRRAYDALLPVRSIPSQFRAMQNKKMPTERSYFVPLILRPVHAFFGIGTVDDGTGDALKDRFMKVYSADIFEGAAQRYLNYLLVMKKTEESLRRLKRGKKTGFSLFSGGGNTTIQDDGKDEERIRWQMIIDVDAFGQEAEALGVVVGDSPAFVALREAVNAPWTEEP